MPWSPTADGWPGGAAHFPFAPRGFNIEGQLVADAAVLVLLKDHLAPAIQFSEDRWLSSLTSRGGLFGAQTRDADAGADATKCQTKADQRKKAVTC